MNSIRNTKLLSPTLNKTYVSIIVNYSYTSKWYLTIMPVNFYLTKCFFLHDITLIASVVGESVIGHGIGGINIPAKMAQLSIS
jgi:hypothetical protein